MKILLCQAAAENSTFEVFSTILLTISLVSMSYDFFIASYIVSQNKTGWGHKIMFCFCMSDMISSSSWLFHSHRFNSGAGDLCLTSSYFFQIGAIYKTNISNNIIIKRSLLVIFVYATLSIIILLITKSAEFFCPFNENNLAAENGSGQLFLFFIFFECTSGFFYLSALFVFVLLVKNFQESFMQSSTRFSMLFWSLKYVVIFCIVTLTPNYVVFLVNFINKKSSRFAYDIGSVFMSCNGIGINACYSVFVYLDSGTMHKEKSVYTESIVTAVVTEVLLDPKTESLLKDNANSNDFNF